MYKLPINRTAAVMCTPQKQAKIVETHKLACHLLRPQAGLCLHALGALCVRSLLHGRTLLSSCVQLHLVWLASTSLLLLQVIAVIIKLCNLARDWYTNPAYRCPVLLPPTHPTGHTQGVYHLVQSLCWKSVQAQHLSHAGGRNPCRYSIKLGITGSLSVHHSSQCCQSLS